MRGMGASAPILRLNEDVTERVVMTVAQIEKRAALNPEEDVFRQMNDRLADLLSLQIILEVMYEMAVNKVIISYTVS